MKELISGVDVLYHESTFLKDKEELAHKTGHSTAAQAAQLAKDSNVHQLVLGHYSSRYQNIELFKEEAQEYFENVHLAKPGKIFEFSA